MQYTTLHQNCRMGTPPSFFVLAGNSGLEWFYFARETLVTAIFAINWYRRESHIRTAKLKNWETIFLDFLLTKYIFTKTNVNFGTLDY